MHKTTGCSQKTATEGPTESCSFSFLGFVLSDASSCWTDTSAINVETQCYSKSAWRASMLSHVYSINPRHAALNMRLAQLTHVLAQRWGDAVMQQVVRQHARLWSCKVWVYISKHSNLLMYSTCNIFRGMSWGGSQICTASVSHC